MTIAILAFLALSTFALTCALVLLIWSAWRGLAKHRAELETMRRELKTYDQLRTGGGAAQTLTCTPDVWMNGGVVITMSASGLSLQTRLAAHGAANLILQLQSCIERENLATRYRAG